MISLQEPAYAKLNLTLDVLGKRKDGYHALRTVMQTVSLCDMVHLDLTEETEGVSLDSNLDFLPTDASNLAMKAAMAFQAATGVTLSGLQIHLNKKIPVCAGLAGGSSDAAAVLRGLNKLCKTRLSREKLAKIGETVGSDVPFCVLGGTVRAEGRGERLTYLHPIPVCHIVLCKPGFSISTPELFRQMDDHRPWRHPDNAGMERALAAGELPEVAQRMYNVFEDALPAQQKQTIQEIKSALLEYGAIGASLSGTGPTVFGLFSDEVTAAVAAIALKLKYEDTFLAAPVGAITM